MIYSTICYFNNGSSTLKKEHCVTEVKKLLSVSKNFAAGLTKHNFKLCEHCYMLLFDIGNEVTHCDESLSRGAKAILSMSIRA